MIPSIRWIPAGLVLGAGIFFSGSTRAQAVAYTWKASLEHVAPDPSPKPLFQAIIDAYSAADVAHDRATGMLTITTSAIIEQDWLEQVAAAAGFTVSGFWRDGRDVMARRDELGPVDNGVGTTNAHTDGQ